MSPWKQALVGVAVLATLCAALAWRSHLAEARHGQVHVDDVMGVARAEAERIKAEAEGTAPPRRHGGGDGDKAGGGKRPGGDGRKGAH